MNSSSSRARTLSVNVPPDGKDELVFEHEHPCRQQERKGASVNFWPYLLTYAAGSRRPSSEPAHRRTARRSSSGQRGGWHMQQINTVSNTAASLPLYPFNFTAPPHDSNRKPSRERCKYHFCEKLVSFFANAFPAHICAFLRSDAAAVLHIFAHSIAFYRLFIAF